MAELAVGVVPLVIKLASASMECYKIFDDISNVGNSGDALLHNLRTQGLRLKGWEDAWGLQNDLGQQRLDPTDTDNNLQDDNKKSNSTTTGFPTLRKTTF